MLGQGWQSQWARVQRRLDDVRAVYTGRPGDTVFPGTAWGSVAMVRRSLSADRDGMSAHRFYVASAGIEHDALHLAEDATAEWHRFLSSQGLIS